MSNQISQLLAQWYPLRDEQQWVLAQIVETDGPSYRKAGSVMLLSEAGLRLGLLSGGCLEADLLRHAGLVMADGAPKLVCYDMRDDADLTWELGIGCGGMVKILLQYLTKEHDYLGLGKAFEELQAGRPQWLCQRMSSEGYALTHDWLGVESARLSQWLSLEERRGHRGTRIDQSGEAYLLTPVFPVTHLAIFGGGVDAQPLVAMALQMGWKVTVFDQRSAYARSGAFLEANHIDRTPLAEIDAEVAFNGIDAAVVMQHNLDLDALALKLLAAKSLSYFAVLGPRNRLQRLLNRAGLIMSDFVTPPQGPAGLDLGGDLPEHIALSILAQCQADIYGGTAQRLAKVPLVQCDLNLRA